VETRSRLILVAARESDSRRKKADQKQYKASGGARGARNHEEQDATC
jgi:hypothetical protein